MAGDDSFTTLVGVVFVIVYSMHVHWSIAPAFLLTIPLLGVLSSVLSRRIKAMQKQILQSLPVFSIFRPF